MKIEDILGFALLFIIAYITYWVIFVMDKDLDNQDFWNEPFL